MEPLLANADLDWLSELINDWSGLPRQQALYRALREAIVDGRLRAGQRMPSTRAIGAALGIARNTALAAVARLQAEGYTLSRHGAGTFVAEGLPERFLHSRAQPARRTTVGAARLSKRSSGWLRIEDAPRRRSAGAFVPGMPDLRSFPFVEWWRLLHKHQRNAPWQGFDYGKDGGLPALKSAVAAHLRLARSVVCEPDQVLITSGTQQSLDLSCRLLADPGDRFAMEDPGYLGARAAALANGLIPVPVPVDHDGIRCERLPRQPPRLMYVTPSHQFPLGAVMSLARRRALLAYAAQHGAYVLEDDYDAEFRFVGTPLAALQGLDRNDRVLYLGTFSKVLYPALQLAYLVLPAALVEAFRRTQERLYGIGHAATQSALAEFLDSGRFASHIRRMRLQYGERNALLQALLRDRLPSGWALLGTDAGQHCALLASSGVDDLELATRAEQVGLTLRPMSPHYLTRPARHGCLLGYAAADTRELQRGVKQLLTLIRASP
jgi:GntR family transcriptional regulator/MocR family aminotransferase